MKVRCLLYCIGVIALSACKPVLESRVAQQEDVQVYTRSVSDNPTSKPCYDPLSYVEHYDLVRTRFIRVNMHFMNSTDGRYNMPEADAHAYAKEWIHAANYNLERNMKMFLPHGNNTPVLNIPYRYLLSPDPSKPGDDGVYYHIDDELCFAVKSGRHRNISDMRVINKYAVRQDSVLNIFLQTHHLDSIGSKTYQADGSGISLGSSVKIFGRWHKKPGVWDNRGILNHEIGHSLGLSHTWGGHDGCDDTPPHPNCYNKSNKPPCDTMYSNNMMDYNAHEAALTPCQIGKVLLNMSREGTIQRNILVRDWCHLDTSKVITITDSVRWNASMDLKHQIVIQRNATLEIGCRVSMPAGATIWIEPGGKLVMLPGSRLHNSCGHLWNGIQLMSERKESGQLFLIEDAIIEDISTPLRSRL